MNVWIVEQLKRVDDGKKRRAQKMECWYSYVISFLHQRSSTTGKINCLCEELLARLLSVNRTEGGRRRRCLCGECFLEEEEEEWEIE